jgi:hypothetical protein
MATAAECLAQAASLLAACARPAIGVGAHSTPEQLSSALTDLVSAAELFGCKPPFWRCAADAAALLGRDSDALNWRARAGG